MKNNSNKNNITIIITKTMITILTTTKMIKIITGIIILRFTFKIVYIKIWQIWTFYKIPNGSTASILCVRTIFQFSNPRPRAKTSKPVKPRKRKCPFLLGKNIIKFFSHQWTRISNPYIYCVNLRLFKLWLLDLALFTAWNAND